MSQYAGDPIRGALSLPWQQADRYFAEMTDPPVSRTEHLTKRIKHELLHRFCIDHPVLQFETADCGQGTLLCEVACNGDADHAVEIRD